MIIPDKDTGVVAYGIKTGIITCDDNIVNVIEKTLERNPDIIGDGDILCVTEAVVAITQHNIISLNEVALEIRKRLNLNDNSCVGVLHPILSRNRFSMILKAIAKAVPKGKVIVQLKFPDDEQGNPLLSKEMFKKTGKKRDDLIRIEELGTERLLHPETGVDYIDFYDKLIREYASESEIFLSNVPKHMVEKNPNAIIVSSVHERDDTLVEVKETGYTNAITLQHICSTPQNAAYSEYGLLGSNILDPINEELKLMPKTPDAVCEEIRIMIEKNFKKSVDVLIYGDGAYKDPESGIYELADPVSCFGCTMGIKARNRIGVKTKYLMQKLYNEGKSKTEIAQIIEEEKKKFLEEQKIDGFNAQGTTPRKIENLAASLADLVSGSGDANTPIVVIRNFG